MHEPPAQSTSVARPPEGTTSSGEAFRVGVAVLADVVEKVA
ncbi:hypothetical protein [Rudanella lutea]|nr:hypothetical protein [Rudanella lutea]